MPTLAPTPLELLCDALLAAKDLRGAGKEMQQVQTFQRRIGVVLMEQVLAQDPHAVALGNGMSILALSAAAHPELALAWRQLRGVEAWAATPYHPYPLSAVLNIGTLQKLDYFHIEDPVAMQAFMLEGLAQSMPLTVHQARHWQDQPFTEAMRKQVDAQRDVANAIVRTTDPHHRQALIQALLAHDGAIPSGCRIAQEMGAELVVARVLLPDTPIVDAVKEKRFVPWWRTWANRKEYADAEDLAPVFQAHGIHIPNFFAHMAKYEGDQVLRRLHNGAAIAGMCEEIEQLHQRLSPGACLPYGETLLWHKAVEAKPALLPVLLKHPHGAQVLTALSAQGYGIWDALVDAIDSGKKVSRVAMDMLATLVSPNEGKGGVIWKSLLGVGEARSFLLGLGEQHPKFLMGDFEQQRTQATQMLVQRVETAAGNSTWWDADQWDRLFDVNLPVHAVCPELRLAMHLVRDDLLQDRSKLGLDYRQSLPNLRHEPLFDPPEKISQAWMHQAVKQVREAAEEENADTKTSDRLLAALEASKLSQTTTSLSATPRRVVRL